MSNQASSIIVSIVRFWFVYNIASRIIQAVSLNFELFFALPLTVYREKELRGQKWRDGTCFFWFVIFFWGWKSIIAMLRDLLLVPQHIRGLKEYTKKGTMVQLMLGISKNGFLWFDCTTELSMFHTNTTNRKSEKNFIWFYRAYERNQQQLHIEIEQGERERENHTTTTSTTSTCNGT